MARAAPTRVGGFDVIPSLPTVPCKYCGQPTTYTATRQCDPCHGASGAPIDTLRKIIAEHDGTGDRAALLEGALRSLVHQIENCDGTAQIDTSSAVALLSGSGNG